MAERERIEARRRSIAQYIEANGRAEISELEKLIGATEYTIRRDLVQLEKSGMIVRTHGGAIRKEREKSIWQTTTISSRMGKNTDLKERIGAYAASLINDGESIMIDGGSTTQIFAGHLRDRHNLLTVTTSPGIAEIMLASEDSHVVLIGGELLRGTHMVSGADAEEHLMKYFVDKCIISVTGAEPEIGAVLFHQMDVAAELQPGGSLFFQEDLDGKALLHFDRIRRFNPAPVRLHHRSLKQQRQQEG